MLIIIIDNFAVSRKLKHIIVWSFHMKNLIEGGFSVSGGIRSGCKAPISRGKFINTAENTAFERFGRMFFYIREGFAKSNH